MVSLPHHWLLPQVPKPVPTITAAGAADAPSAIPIEMGIPPRSTVPFAATPTPGTDAVAGVRAPITLLPAAPAAPLGPCALPRPLVHLGGPAARSGGWRGRRNGAATAAGLLRAGGVVWARICGGPDAVLVVPAKPKDSVCGQNPPTHDVPDHDCTGGAQGPGGRLQPVLMRHPPQLSVKTRGGGGGGRG